jgi:hypothetical protein
MPLDVQIIMRRLIIEILDASEFLTAIIKTLTISKDEVKV